jgi:GDSL-like Lipase/Acylhydrolase family
MRAKKVIYGLLLAALSALLALAVAEAGLRLWMGIADENPAEVRHKLERSRRASLAEASRGAFSLMGLVEPSEFEDVVYELKPKLDGSFRGRPVRTNSLGMRGEECSPRKPRHVFRVAGIGDSHMFGWGVGQDETYMHLVEQRLNASAAAARDERRYELLNFAVPGYNTVMEVATYEHRAMAFAPDMVLLHFVGNDFGLPHFMQLPRSREPGAHLYLADFLRARFAPPDEDPDLAHDLHGLPEDQRQSTRDRYERMVGQEAYEQAMARLASLTRRQRIPVVVLALGFDTEAGEIARRASAANGFRVLDASPYLFAYLRRHGLDPAERQDRVRAFKQADGHPSALAHQVLAEVVYDELQRMGVAPRQSVPAPPLPPPPSPAGSAAPSASGEPET